MTTAEPQHIGTGKLAQEFVGYINAARDERFEDGMESRFSERVRKSILNDGSEAVSAWAHALTLKDNAYETTQEFLRIIGDMRDLNSHEKRREVLTDMLRHKKPAVRDAAGLGLGRPGRSRHPSGSERSAGRGTRGMGQERTPAGGGTTDGRMTFPREENILTQRAKEVNPVQEGNDGQRDSDRQRELDAMLEEALARPGVKEMMKVYHNWVNVSRVYESCLQATAPHGRVTTTDRPNAM